MKERIDKLIASQSMMTRSDVARLIKNRKITINGVTIKSASTKADTENDKIEIDAKPFIIKQHIYIMLNKPGGIVSASRSPKDKTVIDLVPENLLRENLFPAGRLDKDTTGFVLITDDGAFAHNILSPKKHIEKTYLAETDSLIDDKFIIEMRNGMLLSDEKLLPADICLVESDKKIVYKIILHEGKYHQIKRMIGASNAKLISLKRIKMGNLSLDTSLNEGECREITKEELELICSKDK